MRKLITIVLALIMAMFTAPNKDADQPPVPAEKPPQTVITATVGKYPKEAKKPQK